jgi:hypothetical protein
LPDVDVKNGFTSKLGKCFKRKIGATRPLPMAGGGQMSPNAESFLEPESRWKDKRFPFRANNEIGFHFYYE